MAKFVADHFDERLLTLQANLQRHPHTPVKWLEGIDIAQVEADVNWSVAMRVLGSNPRFLDFSSCGQCSVESRRWILRCVGIRVLRLAQGRGMREVSQLLVLGHDFAAVVGDRGRSFSAFLRETAAVLRLTGASSAVTVQATSIDAALAEFLAAFSQPSNAPGTELPCVVPSVPAPLQSARSRRLAARIDEGVLRYRACGCASTGSGSR